MRHKCDLCLFAFKSNDFIQYTLYVFFFLLSTIIIRMEHVHNVPARREGGKTYAAVQTLSERNARKCERAGVRAEQRRVQLNLTQTGLGRVLCSLARAHSLLAATAAAAHITPGLARQPEPTSQPATAEQFVCDLLGDVHKHSQSPLPSRWPLMVAFSAPLALASPSTPHAHLYNYINYSSTPSASLLLVWRWCMHQHNAYNTSLSRPGRAPELCVHAFRQQWHVLYMQYGFRQSLPDLVLTSIAHTHTYTNTGSSGARVLHAH